MPSLFTRTGKYLASAATDPGENRVTEAFAVVLDNVRGLPTELLKFWAPKLIRETRGWDERIRTQRHTRQGGFVDLEIRLVAPRHSRAAHEPIWEPARVPDDIVVWVEVKHGAGITLVGGDRVVDADRVAETMSAEGEIGARTVSSRDQLDTYLEDIPGVTAGPHQVRLLVPRALADPGKSGVAYGTWQQLARFLDAYARRHRDSLGEVGAWLIEEFLQFLMEEGLMDEDRLTAEHAFIASAVPATDAILKALWALVEGSVKSHWAAPTSLGTTDLVSTYRSYPIARQGGEPAPSWGGSFVEWGMTPDGFLGSDARHSLVLYAGLTVYPKKNDLAFRPGNAIWMADLTSQDFHSVLSLYRRVWRLKYFDNLLQFLTLEEQAQALADWVVAAFADVTRTPPPT